MGSHSMAVEEDARSVVQEDGQRDEAVLSIDTELGKNLVENLVKTWFLLWFL